MEKSTGCQNSRTDPFSQSRWELRTLNFLLVFHISYFFFHVSPYSRKLIAYLGVLILLNNDLGEPRGRGLRASFASDIYIGRGLWMK